MTDFIEIIFTGPPDPARALQLVRIVDDQGNDVKVGDFYHDGEYWRYQIPVELVPRMVVPKLRQLGLSAETQQAQIEQLHKMESAAQARRRALKERVTGSPRKGESAPMPAIPSPPTDWEPCPSCKVKFDPREHAVQSCPQCGEDKCTAACLPNPTQPCVDCQALVVGEDEGGFEGGGRGAIAPAPPAVNDSAAPTGVFSPGFSAQAKQVADVEAEEEERG